MRGRRIPFVIAVGAIAVGGLSTGGFALAKRASEPGSPPIKTVISYEEAVKRGLPVVRDFRPPPGVPLCFWVELAVRMSKPQPRDDAAVCFARAEDQDLWIVLDAEAGPVDPARSGRASESARQ